MIFGKQAFENCDQSADVVDHILRNDDWLNGDIASFVCFWSGRLWLTIDGMQERIESVYANVLIAPNPSIDTIKKSLKTKSNRWANLEVDRIAPIVEHFVVRTNGLHFNQFDHHRAFQAELGAIGPVLTMWCHYLIEPRSFPPIDKFNYTAWQFVTQMPDQIPMKVPLNFTYLPVGGENTKYQSFRSWFLGTLNSWRNGHHTVRDMVDLDKSLMSFGAFIQKNSLRATGTL